MAGDPRYSLNLGMHETNLVAEEQAHLLARKFAGMFGDPADLSGTRTSESDWRAYRL